jgi:hypothetical protein
MVQGNWPKLLHAVSKEGVTKRRGERHDGEDDVSA